MKKISFLLAVLGIISTMTFFQSCSSGNNEGTTTVYANALVTVKPNADNSKVVLQLDDNTKLSPVNMTVSPFGTKEVRALTNFSYVEQLDGAEGRSVHVNWIDSILTKTLAQNFSEKENLEKYGSDCVEIVNDWVTIAEDGYLTLRFRTIWGGGVTHYINMVYREDANNPYTLTLYHNANGNTTGVLGDALVAFKLDGLPDTEGKTVDLTLEWMSYSGPKSTKFKYCTRKTTQFVSADALERVGNNKME